MRCLGQFLQRGAVAAPREIQAACVELEQECYKLKFVIIRSRRPARAGAPCAVFAEAAVLGPL
eukprot:8201709-Pyramimonas_sp.AAC.1